MSLSSSRRVEFEIDTDLTTGTENDFVPFTKASTYPLSPASAKSPKSPNFLLQGASSNIKVCVRVRPFNSREAGEKLCVAMPTETTVVISDDDGDKEFTFDRCYWSHDESKPSFATQQTLMDEIGQDMTQSVLQGFNNCLFAYGQTGSGKTHSVLGLDTPPEMRGLLPRIVEDLFSSIQDEAKNAEFDCRASYLEIYNEQIRDLLVPPQTEGPTLKVHQHPKLGVVIPHLIESAVTNDREVNQIIDFGAKARTVAATSMNDRSSRSHCIFSIEVKQSQDKGGVQSQLRSKLNLVDLAGSERQKKTQAEGARLKEGSMINQSLTTLALVIHKLAEMSESVTKKSKDFVPFRNSKLTFILSDSLSGNSKTVMIAALSPALSNHDETLGTLRFATSVKAIKTTAVKNEESEESIVAELRAECERLRQQLQQGGDSEMKRETSEQLQEMEWMEKKYGQNFEAALEESKRMEQIRERALTEMGLGTKGITESLGIDNNVPQLLNLSDDPSLNGCLMYFLTDKEVVTIGSGPECKIKLNGLGVKPMMCEVTNIKNTRLCLTPADADVRVLVNGLQVCNSCDLNHRDRLILGHAYCFRVVIPTAAAECAEELAAQHEFLEHALAEVVPEESEDYQQCHLYVEELQERIGEMKANAFLRGFRRVVPLVEEANAITMEVLPKSRLQMRLEIINDIFTYQTDEPECVIRLLKFATGAKRFRNVVKRSIIGQDISNKSNKRTQHLKQVALRQTGRHHWKTETETIAVWDIHEFKLRLQHMREVYDIFRSKGHDALDFRQPESNPWCQLHPWDVHHLLQEQRHRFDEEQTEAEVQNTVQQKDDEMQALKNQVQALQAQLTATIDSLAAVHELTAALSGAASPATPLPPLPPLPPGVLNQPPITMNPGRPPAKGVTVAAPTYTGPAVLPPGFAGPTEARGDSPGRSPRNPRVEAMETRIDQLEAWTASLRLETQRWRSEHELAKNQTNELKVRLQKSRERSQLKKFGNAPKSN